jgi:alanine racemase
VLFGKQGNADITQAEMEDINGALLADLYTVWGNSNPRRLK